MGQDYQIKRRKHAEDGTIMVDALVAVVIISIVIAVCMTSLNLARKAWIATEEARQARLTLQALLETTPRIPGNYNGTKDGLPYRVTVSEQKSGDLTLCAIHAEVSPHAVTKATSGQRTFDLDGTRWRDKVEAP